MAIDIGPDATTRVSNASSGNTIIAKDNPANASGTLTSIEIYAVIALGNCVVGTFYTTNGDTLKCRDSAALGTIAAGSKQTITEDSGSNPLAITVETGDYIGMYFTSGNIYRDTSGFAGFWYIEAEHIDPNDEATYSVAAGDTISLYGTGVVAPVDYPISTSCGLTASATIDREVAWDRGTSPGLTTSATVDREVAWDRGTSPGLTASATVDREVAWDRAVPHIATETLRPNATGDEESISSATSGEGKHHLDVDDVEADDNTTQVYTESATYQRDLYNLPASSGSGTINFIEVFFRCTRFTGGYAKPSLKSGSTVDDGTEITLSTWTTYSEQWATNPDDSEAWEWADIDALQIGVSLKMAGEGVAYCTQVYVVVDYTSTLNLTASTTIVKAWGRLITTSPGLTVAVTIARSMNRTITTNTALAISTTISRALAWGRALTPGLTAAVAIAKKVAWDKATQPALSVAVSVVKTVAWDRALQPGLTVAVTIARSLAFLITTSTALAISVTIYMAFNTYTRRLRTFAGRALKAFTGRSLSDFAGRGLSDTTNRDLSDDNDEFREM